MPAPKRGRPEKRWLVVVAAVAVGLAAYVNSLRNDFVWDDTIVLSRQLVVFDSIAAVLVTPRGIPQYSPDYYRPLTVASLLLDRAIGGTDPFIYHLSVVLLHALTSGLVALFALQLFGTTPAGVIGAATAGILFAAHPVHTESVAWIAGRSDVLATSLLLAALIVHRRGPSWRGSALTGMFVLAALGAKENAIVVLVLLVLLDVTVPRDESRPWRMTLRPWHQYAGPAVATALYLILRRVTLGGFVGNAPVSAGFERSVADVIGAIGAYLLKLVWPFGLNAYIDDVPSGPVGVSLTLAALTGLAALVWWLWRRGERLAVFSLLWIGLTLAPSLTIVWKIPDAPMAERYLYLPSVGLCLLAGQGVSRLWAAQPTTAWRSVIIAGLVLGVSAAMLLTVRRNAVWHDDVSLWSDTMSKGRVAGMPTRSLATAYQQRGQVEQARRYFGLALERRNTPSGLQTIYNNLGTLAMQAGDFGAARQYYQQALAANPLAADPLFNLGLAILQGGGGTPAAADEALGFLVKAAELNPHDADIQAALGQAYGIKGERQRAIDHLRRALTLGPPPATAVSIRAYLAGLER